jgi:translation initiation factor IF-2
MADKKKTYRINKVATEFNVSWKTIVEHLTEKGFEVETKITAKLDEAMYQDLLGFYQKDKQAKEESQNLEINIRKDVKTKEIEEVKKPEPPKPEFTPEPTVYIKDTSVSKKPTPPTPAPPKKEEPKKIVEKEPEVEVKVEPKKEVIIKPAKDEDTGNLKVLGTIDIVKPKKPKAKKVEVKPEVKAKVEKPVIKKQTPKAEPATEEPEVVVETEYKKLEGTTVLRKIEIKPPVKKTKKKDDEPKKKRKRIRGEKVTAEKLRNERNKPRTGRPGEKTEVTEKDIQAKIKKTLASMNTGKQTPSHGGKVRQKARKFRRQEHKKKWEEKQLQDIEESKILDVTEFVTANDLANMMDVNVNEIIGACFSLGLMVSINQRLDAETIQIVAEEFEYEVNFVDADETIEIDEEEDKEEDLLPRHPIVTVMGHVDHGKTSLLDYIRKANIVDGESGGITQHIGAYSVNVGDQKIAFLDTPGHEAFTAMRARGAQVTDLVIIVAAADDDVMPQTKEAISHAQAAGVPIIFAINKIDKPNANPDNVKTQLSSMNLLIEEWGGNIQSQDISAKTGTGIEELLEKVLLEAEVLELKANPNKNAVGTVVEAQLDKGRGYLTTILVQAGTLKIGDYILAGKNSGKVKAMFDDKGNKLKEAGPSTPVSILGLDGAPQAGDKFNVFDDEREAKQIASKRSQLQREQSVRTQKTLTLDEIGRRIALGDFKELNIILKGDVDGSVEALTDSFQKLSTEEIQVNILHKGVGAITESDVLLATASDAIIVGFNVRPQGNARVVADREEVDIRTYSIIYDAINDLKDAMEGMLSPVMKEEISGTVEIREIYKISKVGNIAGCMVMSGKIFKDSQIRIIRDGIVVHDGTLTALKRFKDDVREVAKGFDCGIQIKNYNDIVEGDVIEAYKEVAVKKKLK